MTKQKQLTECPKCKHGDICVYTIGAYVIELSTGLRIEDNQKRPAVCNYPDCGQRFWYYPSTGRVTRRRKWYKNDIR